MFGSCSSRCRSLESLPVEVIRASDMSTVYPGLYRYSIPFTTTMVVVQIKFNDVLVRSAPYCLINLNWPLLSTISKSAVGEWLDQIHKWSPPFLLQLVEANMPKLIPTKLTGYTLIGHAHKMAMNKHNGCILAILRYGNCAQFFYLENLVFWADGAGLQALYPSLCIHSWCLQRLKENAKCK